MPRPVYIVCSLSGAEDRVLNLVSLFHVVEKLVFTRLQPEAKPLTFRVTAVWMRVEGEAAAQVFESRLLLHLPGGQPEVLLAETLFSFSHPYHRFIADVHLSGGMVGSGMMRLESQVRRQGEVAWVRQEYPILLEEVVPVTPGTPPVPSTP